MSNYKLSPVIKESFDTEAQDLILEHIERQEKLYGSDFIQDNYFALRRSNGLKTHKRIDFFVNKFNIVLLFETED